MQYDAERRASFNGVASCMAAKPCLLVVDDEPDLVDSVRDLLRPDYKVLVATKASDGLRLMEQERVQIVMSDQRMPEMTGVEMLSRIREHFPDTVRLLFTAFADLDVVINAINQGSVYRYISKPWETSELKATLRQAYEFYQLQAERRSLLSELQTKNAQLEAANAELQRGNELKKAFIKVASHELRTPLTVLLGYVDLLNELTPAPSELHVCSTGIHRAASRLNERVDQIVKLMLAEHFDRPFSPTPMPIADIVETAVADVRTFVNQRRQHIAVTLAPDLGLVNVEADKIHDSLVQLLINAIKFTPDGGDIFVTALRLPESRVRITITDTGIGIDPESLTHIFAPFFTRFDVSRHSSGTFEYEKRGLGLGLSMAKAFIDAHGGTLIATSEVGKGTTFTIELPSRL